MSNTTATTRITPNRLLAWLNVRPGDAEEKAARKARLGDLKAEATFNSKLKAVNAAIKELDVLPGIDDKRAGVTDGLLAAEALGAGGRFSDAVKALDRLEASIARARADGAKAGSAARKRFPDLLSRADQLHADISGAQPAQAPVLRRRDDPRNLVGDQRMQIPPAERSTYLDQMRDALRVLYTADTDSSPDARAAVQAGLDQVERDVRARAAQYASERIQAAELLRAVTRHIGRVRPWVPPAEFAELTRDYQIARSLCGAKEFAQALTPLQSLNERLWQHTQATTQDLDTWRMRQGRVQGLQDEAGRLLEQIKPLVPMPPDLGDTLKTLDALRRLTAGPEPVAAPYAEALAQLDACERAVQQLRDTLPIARATAEKWAELATRLPGLIAASRTMVGKTRVPILANTRPIASETLNKLLVLEAYAAEPAPPLDRMSYPDAIRMFDECDTEVQTQRGRAELYRNELADRIEQDRQVRDAIAAVDTALKIRQAEPTGSDARSRPARHSAALIAELEGDLARLTATWNRRMETAPTVADLRADELLDQLSVLQTGTYLRDPVALEQRYNAGVLAGVRRRIDELVAQTRASLDELIRFNASRSEEYSTELNRLTRPGADGAAAVKLERDLQQLHQQVSQKLSVERSLSEGMQRALTMRIDVVERKLTEFSSLITKGKEPDYGPMRDTFRRMLDEQRWATDRVLDDGRRIGGVTETTALESVGTPLQILSDHIDEAMAGLKAGGSLKSGVVSVKSLSHQLDELRRQLEHRTVKTYMRETQARLLDRVATLKSSVPSMPLADGLAQVETCRQAVEEARTLADQKNQDYTTFETRINLAGARLDSRFANAPDYLREKQADLARFRAAGLAEGELTGLLQEVDRWENDIKSVRDRPDELGIRQTAAKATAGQAEEDRARWQGHYDEYIKRAKALTPLFSTTPTQQLFDKNRSELEQLGRAADRAFKANNDLGAALEQLKLAHERIDFLEKYPDGTGAAMRADLPRVNGRWRNAVASLGSGFDSLWDALRKADQDISGDVLASVRHKLTELRVRFNPAAFDEAIALLTDPGVAPGRKASIREAALRTLKRLQDCIENNSDLAALADNPFHPGLHADIVNAGLVLLDVETNLLGCL